MFADPFAMMSQDRIEGGELRWQPLGRVGGYLVSLVAHTVGEDDEKLKPSASFRRKSLIAKRKDAIKTKMVKREIDLQSPPPSSNEQRATGQTERAVQDAGQ